MASGDQLISGDGSEHINSTGEEMMDNGTDNSCCCGAVCTYCGADAPPKKITVEFGNTAWAGSTGCIQIGSLYYKFRGNNSLNGKICLTQTASPCVWQWCQVQPSGGNCFGYTTYTDSGCTAGASVTPAVVCITLTKTNNAWEITAKMGALWLFKDTLSDIDNDCYAERDFTNDQTEPGVHGSETWAGGGIDGGASTAHIVPGDCESTADIATKTAAITLYCDVEIAGVEMWLGCKNCTQDGLESSDRFYPEFDPNGFYDASQTITTTGRARHHLALNCPGEGIEDVNRFAPWIAIAITCTTIQITMGWSGGKIFDSGLQPYTWTGECQNFSFNNTYTDWDEYPVNVCNGSTPTPKIGKNGTASLSCFC